MNYNNFVNSGLSKMSEDIINDSLRIEYWSITNQTNNWMYIIVAIDDEYNILNIRALLNGRNIIVDGDKAVLL